MTKFSQVAIIFAIIIFGTILPILSLDLANHTASARCPNGTRKSPSGDCEKPVDNKGKPRCPDGYHRSPDGDCERVSGSSSSSSNKDDNDKNSSKNKDKKSTESKPDSFQKSSTGRNNPKPGLPTPTLKEGIEISGPITYIVDGDTLDINNIRIRLALVNTPEVGESGYSSAKQFAVDHCLNKNGEVDMDDGQREGSFGRQIGVVYCDGMNLNQALMSNNLALILTEFCEVSEFANEPWAKSSCSPNSIQEDQQDDSISKDKNSVTTESSPHISSDLPTYEPVTKWGSSGIGRGQFNHPASIETDQNGQRLYVADLDNNRVEVVDADGHFITEWGSLGDGNGQFNGPGSIAVDNQNKIVFVADIKNNRIEKFDVNGKYLTQWGTMGKGEGQFDHPGDIALDPEEEILYITDIYNNRVQAYYYDGNFIGQWGTFGSGEGQFNRPAGITINPKENLIYVSDTVNNRIQILDSDGNFITKWGSFGTGDGQFNRPDGIHFEPSEKLIYVADRKNHRIQIFDPQGTYVNEWQISDSSTGDLIKPRDVALNPSGGAYVVDKTNNNIFIYRTAETNLSSNSDVLGEIPSGSERIVLNAQFKPEPNQFLAKDGWYVVNKFGLVASSGSEICPLNNCKYTVENTELSPSGINYNFQGKLKVTTTQDEIKKSIFYDFFVSLDTAGEEVRDGKTIQFLEGTFGLDKKNNPSVEYDITHATYLLDKKSPVLTIEGERTP